MIVMRIDRVLGSCKIHNYDTEGEGGWFPLASVNFGFTPKTDTVQSGGSAGGNPTGSRGGGNHRGNNADSRNQGGANGGQGDKFTEMSITKAVDVATVPLMQLAMDSRSDSGNKPADSAVTIADIHFIGSVNASQSEDIYTFTFLRIHLDTVRILNWSVNGSGDERPSETVTIGYEKAAMSYQPTPDAKTIQAKGQAGWDQKEHKKWNTVTAFYPNFPDA